MKPALNLQPSQNSYAPGERICLNVVLGNPSDTVMRLPLPSTAWTSHVSVRVVRPDGTLIELPAEPHDPTSGAGAHRLEVWPGGEAVAAMQLYDVGLAWMPGEYTATATIQTQEGLWTTTGARFRLESLGSLELAAALPPGLTEDQPFSLWTLHHGAEGTVLQRRAAGWVSPDSTTEIRVEAPERLLELPSDATGLVALATSDGAEWLAWRRPATIGIALVRGRRWHTEASLPGPTGRLIGMVPGPRNGVRVLVLDAGGTTLWCHHATPPPTAAAPIISGGAAAGEVSWPTRDSSLPPLAPAGQIALPWPTMVLGAAARPDGPVALVAAREAENGIDVGYTLLAAEGVPAWRHCRIPGAFLLPGAGPAVAIGADDIAEIALLVSADVAKVRRLALIRLAFDATVRPVERRGVGWFDLGPLETMAEAAATILHNPLDEVPALANWCVLLPGNRVVAGVDAPERRASLPKTAVTRPLCLIGAGKRLGLVTTDDAGRIRIVEL